MGGAHAQNQNQNDERKDFLSISLTCLWREIQMCHFSDTSWKRTVHSYLLVVRSSNKRAFITLPINAVYIVDMFDQLSKGSQ